MQGVYQVKEPHLVKYLERVRYLISCLQEVTVEFVPRTLNQRVDVFAKLASTRKPGNNRSAIQETLMHPSIEGELIGCVDRGPRGWARFWIHGWFARRGGAAFKGAAARSESLYTFGWGIVSLMVYLTFVEMFDAG